MELSIYNIKGEVTDKKVTLDDSIFGIEPNNHVIWLDVKHYMANQRKGRTNRKKEARLPEVRASLSAKKVAVVLVVATSTLPF
mgnify:CR=1 FL=1